MGGWAGRCYPALGCRPPERLRKNRRHTPSVPALLSPGSLCRMPRSRSEQMSRIRGKNTEPELVLRRMLWHQGLRYRLHARTAAGRPDLVFPGPKVAVFIDGCFWHGCPDHYVRPRSSSEFWAGKLGENVRRDIAQTRQLEDLGWRVCRVWEHEVLEDPGRVARKVTRAVKAQKWRADDSWRVLRVTPLDREGTRERRHLRELRGRARSRAVTRIRSTRKWKRSRELGPSPYRNKGLRA